MKLSQLIKACEMNQPGLVTAGMDNDPDISSLASNSKSVKPGSLFIAIKGLQANGHDYIEQAFDNGAMAVVAETNPDGLKNVLLVKNSRQSMAAIAAEFYGHPSKELTLVGITGTNGKTTTTWLLESIFKASHLCTGVIGTVNIRYKNRVFDNPITTPDAIELQRTLFEMKTAGVTHVVMEVSSHGLHLNRVDFSQFDAGVFTNLSQDHLDYHKTIDDYFECKKRFFTEFLGSGQKEKPGVAILNIDDPKGKALAGILPYKTLGISTKIKTDIFARDMVDDIHGLSGNIYMGDDSIRLTSSLTGRFNLENILCAAGAAHALNISNAFIKKGLENCRSIPGRLEKVETRMDRFLFVDYAHTPDALESILATLKKRAPGRIITVFGCGGDRDRSKRPIMGQAACRYSDVAIATSDNPRTESPESIIRDILKGMVDYNRLSDRDLSLSPRKKGYLVEVDRRKAIRKAVFLSKPGDIIIAAGKGHENYQITNEGTIHFDDKEELQAAAREFDNQFTPIPWKISDLSAALHTSPCFLNAEEEILFTGISIDSRTSARDQVFLAVKGENFDGHTFIKDLIDKGIRGFVVEKAYLDTLDETEKKELLRKNRVVFETDNTQTALGLLARYQRNRSNVKLIAITGSSGKTTTRKIIEEIFKVQFHTHATTGNFNNEIGLPLTLLNLSYAHEWAIIEMGMNHPGEISRLSRIACPDIAMVINTTGAHLEGLGSLENVAKAKAEIFEAVRKNGTAILFADDPRRNILEAAVGKNENIKKRLLFGQKDEADVKSVHVASSGSSVEFTTISDGRKDAFSINSPARFMVNNCLAAICAAKTAGIHTRDIQKGFDAFTPVTGRMNIYSLSDTITLIDDTYNANPDSVAQALDTLKTISGVKENIAVLGDMLELGNESVELHRQIGQKAAVLGIKKLYLFGSQVRYMIEGAIENGFHKDNIFHGDKHQIAKKIFKTIHTDTCILVKGSRGMAMENVIQELQNLLTENY